MCAVTLEPVNAAIGHAVYAPAAVNVPEQPCECEACMAGPLERIRYFPRQLITADDMTTEQQYFRQKLRRHNRYLHGWGVVCGCDVRARHDKDRPWLVRLCPGYVVGPQGDEIMIPEAIDFDLAGDWHKPHDPCTRPWPCPPTGNQPAPGRQAPVFLAVRYADCDTRPVRVHPVGCACDECACEYSRTREDFELALLWKYPDSHTQAFQADVAWCQKLKEWKAQNEGGERRNLPNAPVPACPPCAEEPWVVLATILLPPEAKQEINDSNITYLGRRVLYSTSALHNYVTCMHS